MTETQPLADAYFAGRDAYLASKPESVNPHIGLRSHWTDTLAQEWCRGYRIARKHARFAATISARRAKKATA